jgi:hypothetical protein
MLIMLENGLDSEVQSAIGAQTKLRAEISDVNERIEKNEIRRQVFDALRRGKKDPQILAQASADADRILSGDIKTPEGLVINNLISQPGFRDQPVAEQNKQIQDAVQGIASARSTGQARQLKTAEEIRQRQVVKDDLQKKHPDWDEAQLELETNAAIAKSKKVSTLSANKAAEYKVLSGRYREADQTIDQVLEILKRPGAAGLAGRAMRLEERLANVLGANSTAYTDLSRKIDLLKTWAPRLLVGTSGRPLKDEAGRINNIVPGLSIGDVQKNTESGLRDLKHILNDLKGDVDGVLSESGGEAPTETKLPAATTGWDRFPTVNE